MKDCCKETSTKAPDWKAMLKHASDWVFILLIIAIAAFGIFKYFTA